MLLITGATGHTGQFLLEELSKSNKKYKIKCFVRANSPNIKSILKYNNIELCYGDIRDEESLRSAFKGIETVIHIVNIKYSPIVARLSYEFGVKRIIFIHTTGMFSKYRKYAKEYKDIEENISRYCKTNYIILRPTMIYGSLLDHNMHKLILFIKRHNFFPVFGSGRGLMQPVYVGDLAKAIVSVLDSPDLKNRCYNISGGSILKYRNILEIIAKNVNPNLKFIYLPYYLSILLVLTYSFINFLVRKEAQLTVEQIKRLNEDKCFSYDEAAKDFGYNPISFEEGIKREIESMNYLFT